MHHEALAVLPELLAGLSLSDPVLVGHSDGASIALIHAAARRWPVAGVVALAPHVVVEERSIAGIEEARDAYRRDDRLRERLRRYHTDPDATFWGWNDVWLDPAFRSWNIEAYLPEISCPVLVVQCADDPYGTLDQVQRIEAAVSAPVEPAGPPRRRPRPPSPPSRPGRRRRGRLRGGNGQAGPDVTRSAALNYEDVT